MPDSVEHRVEMHQLATTLRRSGRPIWSGKLVVSGVFHNDELTFIEKRDRIVEIVKASQWYREADPDEPEGLVELIDNLAIEETREDFDYWWDLIYDLADNDRVWIKTR